MKQEEKPICKRCGQCCYIENPDGSTPTKKCRFLIILKSGLTICRNYNRRLGVKTGPDGNTCGMRKDDKYNYKDCPFNVPGKKMLEIKVNRI